MRLDLIRRVVGSYHVDRNQTDKLSLLKFALVKDIAGESENCYAADGPFIKSLRDTFYVMLFLRIKFLKIIEVSHDIPNNSVAGDLFILITPGCVWVIGWCRLRLCTTG